MKMTFSNQKIQCWFSDRHHCRRLWSLWHFAGQGLNNRKLLMRTSRPSRWSRTSLLEWQWKLSPVLKKWPSASFWLHIEQLTDFFRRLISTFCLLKDKLHSTDNWRIKSAQLSQLLSIEGNQLLETFSNEPEVEFLIQKTFVKSKQEIPTALEAKGRIAKSPQWLSRDILLKQF